VRAIGLITRVLLVTALFTMLGFALGGFLGILSIGIMRAAHIPINLQDALWFGAIPGGIIGAIAGLVIITISERRANCPE
jgi:hypothetical protein